MCAAYDIRRCPKTSGAISYMPIRGRAAAVLSAVFLAGLAHSALPASAQEDDRGFASEFFSYFPAPADIKLPDLDIPDFWAGDLKKAQRAYKSGDYVRARKFFQKASEDGNLVADWYLGHMYRLGRGGAQDDAAAFSYYSRVADAFSEDENDSKRLRITVDALVQVANYYRLGNRTAGIAKDFPRAIRIYKVAASYGHPAAQYALGLMHLRGEGMEPNPQNGLKWLFNAARKRYAPAEAELGELYWSGEFVRLDRTRALMWYILARETAKPDENPQIHDRLDQMTAELSEAERLEAEARASVWSEQYPTKTSLR
jgi:hypothetical protein